MLPKELLEVTRRKGRIYPKFARMERDYDLAEKVLKLYRAGVGRKYGVIAEALKKLENARNYKKIRGFAKVIERECKFESPTNLEPVAVRREVFAKGYVTNLKDRENVLREVAKKFGVDVREIEKAMFADREEEKVLVNVPELTPEELIRRYNLSLLQTAIFNCLRLTFWISSNYKNVFRKLKLLGLMYELYEDKSERLLINVSGPASILKLTRRYGTSIAKLIPEIVRADKWWLRAEVVDDYEKRVYFLELSDEHRKLFPDVSAENEKTPYDSSLEESFARKMKYLGFEVIREPGIVKAGDYAYIPDFLVKKGDKKVYIEIAGFWTENYIKKKLEKIRSSKIPLILLVREDLVLGNVKVGRDVILIDKRGRIPYGEVLRKIKEVS